MNARTALLVGVLGIFLVLFFGCNSGQSQLEKEMEAAQHATDREDFITKANAYLDEILWKGWNQWTYGVAVDYEGVNKSLRNKDWSGLIKNAFRVHQNDVQHLQCLSIMHSGGYVDAGRSLKMIVSTNPDSFSKTSPSRNTTWAHDDKITSTTLVVISVEDDPKKWDVLFNVFSASFGTVWLKKTKDSQYKWNYNILDWVTYIFYYSISDKLGFDVTPPGAAFPKETIFFTPSTKSEAIWFFDVLIRYIADEVYGLPKSTTLIGP